MPHSSSPPSATPAGYGNIYTPHAGAMIIHVQREGGLQNRTIILGPRQIELLALITSRTGKIILVCATAILVATTTFVTIEAIKVPQLQYKASRVETLQRSVADLQQRYDQVERMLGVKSIPALPPAASPIHSPGTHGTERDKGSVPELKGKSSVPVD